MLLQSVLFFAAGTAASTLLILIPGAARGRIWLTLPLVAGAIAAAALLAAAVTGDPTAGWVLAIAGLLAVLVTRLLLPRWSLLAAALMGLLVMGSLTYVAYALVLPFIDGLGFVGVIVSLVLVVCEAAALTLSAYYLFEILDVLGRRDRPVHEADPGFQPRVVVQVPCYNEPIEVMRDTLTALARLDYPDYRVQVVDNNTHDEAVWRPIERLCHELGQRFEFIHLDPWPGFKAGALNEATRRLPQDVSIIAIVDADYLVRPEFLNATVGHFADPQVAFVQTPQHYRDWRDDRYLRGLFYSYRYFFDLTMPARAQRNAIIFAGTMGLIRRAALAEIGGWNEACITEDAEASLRLLGRGHRGVYLRSVFGEGLMPLTFDGLKKQRFRWALGGMQILRQRWRELVPFRAHRLRLTTGQRLHYLFGSLHWFSDLLTSAFTILLLLTALSAILSRRLPVRELTGPVVVVPLAFLVTGVLRALWAMRTAVRCTWDDARRALAVWFALIWVDTLAVVRGLISGKAAFLRTPKRRPGGGLRIWAAIRASSVESLIAALAVLGALALIVRAPSWSGGVLAVMLLFEAAIFGSAPWASLAAEGIQLTPQRRVYLRSPQTTGDRPAGRAATLPIALAAVAAAILGLSLLAVPQRAPSTVTRNPVPRIGQIAHGRATSRPTAAPTSSATPSASGTPSASATATATPTASASP